MVPVSMVTGLEAAEDEGKVVTFGLDMYNGSEI